MSNTASSAIAIRQVQNKEDLKTFIRVPWDIYKDDPHWVPPLLIERQEALSTKNPYFEHAEWCAWVAWRGDKPVGRISAQIDGLHQQKYEAKTGFFGLLEAVDDSTVFGALFNAAEDWLVERGMETILGPFNLGINQEIGILIEGFETPPYIMTPHSRSYYDARIKSCGYMGEQDLLAYELAATEIVIPRIMAALMNQSAGKVTVRSLRRGDKKAELEIMRDIFNDAWQENWNFVPFTEKEFMAIGKELLMLVPSDLIQIAEIEGHAVAFVVMIPNINEAIHDLNGRLLPFGWARLLWRLKLHTPKTARVALMGVRQKYQHTRLGPALAYLVIKQVIDAAIGRGIEKAELSWILEHNHGIRHIIESIGGDISKRYRMYIKEDL